MIKSYSVGDDVDAWCTKCRLELSHTIVAMVENLPKRVECNTCHGKHNYKMKPAERKKSTSTRTRKPRPEEIKLSEYLARLADSNVSQAKAYSMNGNFKKDELVSHSKFGMGIVSSVMQPTKIEIFFKDGPKLLAQNK